MSLLLAVGGILDPERLIATFGTIGLFLIIFAESGLLIGFFLPGDSLLFTAGLLSSQDKLPNIALLVLGCVIAAISGDQAGYVFGRRVGPALFRRPDSRLFKQANVEKARAYFEEHGSKTIVLARFVPIVRTFAPIVAGVSHMPYRTFVMFNVVGGVLWAAGVTTLGYVLGATVPSSDKYLLPAVGVIIVVSLIPVALEIRKARREAAELR
ncbi:MAG: VTT domain-containing protein [Acidimicrobiales bacterium]|nr:VTT domain-containing protein [Acidimicrobiales bacterium]